MTQINYYDRDKKKICIEKVYGNAVLYLLYGDNFISKVLSVTALPLIAKFSFFSKVYGFLQKLSYSRKKIKLFIEKYNIDTSELATSIDSFKSFNDFFIRRLNTKARPIIASSDFASMPADARYLVYSDIQQLESFFVKGKKLDIYSLVDNVNLAKNYLKGSIAIARLAPVDCHRYHFPCQCVAEKPKLINGHFYSVNPIAIKKNINILFQNKRILSILHTKYFGKVLYIQIGATNVSSINNIYIPYHPHEKGDEMGYFSFGASSLILLFEPNRIIFDNDLLQFSQQGIETKALMGQSLGKIF